ncbi:hypothetical protein KP509_30G034000 [Ceratopteris richardii]|uniref:Uncharacterized protein n=1 Tax=Ceratopteris richardii TaxID=49495 RepID=A0A8T2R348_CERRI|nr:hypothetical protein KP509_30G034000 [Ceratopteris richardii]KAH7290150.1 hypothetical protein KP509_30G034000 [Ceratopteris richardii]KAH7290151.1 hypothetical protein KP509_30G034000 [Ceratopteris richardii]
MSYKVSKSPKLVSKVPPMHTPGTGAGGTFINRAAPSPLGKGMEGSPGNISSIDYDDVFGGPPRFATSMLAAQTDSPSSNRLKKSTARAASFKSSSLPVYELPVFGDGNSGGRNTFESKKTAVAYEDIFREDVHTPDVFQGDGFLNTSRSKPNSGSNSRCGSPLHAAANFSDSFNSRSSPKPALNFSSTGYASSRNSYSSTSVEEDRSKPLDSSFSLLRTDSIGSSLPSSPPHASAWGHIKGSEGLSNVNQRAPSRSSEVDDVFGGFPHRTYAPIFSAVHPDPLSSSKDQIVIKNVTVGSKPGKNRGLVAPQYFDSKEETSHTLPSSSDVEQELQDAFIEIRMDKQNKSMASRGFDGSTAKGQALVRDIKLSAQSSSGSVHTRNNPSPTSTVPLKHKSWKDWTSNLSAHQPLNHDSSGTGRESVAFNTDSKGNDELNGIISQAEKVLAETISHKQPKNSNIEQQPKSKFELSSSKINMEKFKLLEDSMELEESELHALLTHAWKLNEEREREKSSSTRPPQACMASDTSLQEPHPKEWKRQVNKLSTHVPQDKDAIETDLHWKSLRNYSKKDRKDSTNERMEIDYSQESFLRQQLDSCTQYVHDLAKRNGAFETDDLFDPEEIVKVVAEEIPPCVSNEELGVRATNSGQNKVEAVKISSQKQSEEFLKDEDEACIAALSSENGSMQEFAQHGEVLLSESEEDIDSLIGLDVPFEGVQNIQAETAEYRTARSVTHMQALDEMQRRDAELQRQQKENHHPSEAVDIQIERWAAGKERNIRALLSNLQHVLWADSGWQPISLKDLIEVSDVKKAFRRATLLVHPDKVQQKGATLQQKYIAERLFDILQEAWKAFNLQELF